MNKGNGASWIPSPGVVPVLHPKEQTWLKPLGRETFMVARLLLECDAGGGMETWLTRPMWRMGDILLLGTSAQPSHRWTLTRARLEENTGAAASAWMEDPLDPAEQLALKRGLENVDFTAGDMFPWGGNRLVAADFKRPLRLEDLPRLNREAQDRGMVLVARAELEDVRGEPLEPESYATLAMQLAVERGIDFTRCAGELVMVEEYGPNGFKARLLSATDAGAGRQIEWDIREREWQAAEI